MISVEEAREKVLSGVVSVGHEQVSVAQAVGRVLAETVTARVSHPPADVSAMDGFACRTKDAAGAPTRLVIIGESAAGKPFGQPVTTGKAVTVWRWRHLSRPMAERRLSWARPATRWSRCEAPWQGRAALICW